MSGFELSISIVNWNTCDLLRSCLQSILATKGALSVEIFVVDNNSRDNSFAMVEQEFPSVRLIRNTSNYGFAYANNQAIRLSQAPYILILNPDTVLLEGTLTSMVSFLQTHPEAGAVGGKLLNTDMSLQYSLRTFPTVFTAFTENAALNRLPFIRNLYDEYRLFSWDHNAMREVDQPMGAAIMVKKCVLDTLGAFDEDYHMFFEDVDLCFRIKKNGWKIYYLPDSKIIHHGGCSVRKREKIGEEFYASLIKYIKKNKRKRHMIGTRLVMMALAAITIMGTSPFVFYRSHEWLDIIKASLQIFRYGFSYATTAQLTKRYIP